MSHNSSRFAKVGTVRNIEGTFWMELFNSFLVKNGECFSVNLLFCFFYLLKDLNEI